MVQLAVIILETMARIRSAPLLPNQQGLYDRLVHEYFALLSPCPQVFEYRYDQRGVHGVVSARVPSNVYNSFVAKRMDILAFFHVRGQITDSRNTGTIGLLHDLTKTAKMIKMHQLVQYRIEFPHHTTTPSVENITVNGQAICTSNQPLNMNEISSKIRFHFGLTLLPRPTKVSPFKPTTMDVQSTIQYNEQSKDDSGSSAPQMQGCGKIENKFRLTHSTGDGEEIGRGTWPWLVAIFVKTAGGGLTFKCTGNLLSNRIVVSAAHCFMQDKQRIKPSDVLLSFGRHDLHDWAENGMKLWKIRRIEVPDEDPIRENNSDIAILVTQEFIEYSALVKPICLWPSISADVVGSSGLIVGWANQNEENNVNVPRQLKMEIVAKSKCEPPSSYTSISEQIICAESQAVNEPFNGVSGNGMAIWQNEAWFLKGIVSTAVGDPNLNRFALTDTSKFNAWILKWINKFI